MAMLLFRCFFSVAISILSSFIPLTLSALPSHQLPYVEFIHPNTTFTYMQLLDENGIFLLSRNKIFAASIFYAIVQQQTQIHLQIVHRSSSTVIWSPNIQNPHSWNSNVSLTSVGITIIDGSGFLRWSTPVLGSTVALFMLEETGNFVLLDNLNNSLWETFKYPTDTIVEGQHLLVGQALVSESRSYQLVITEDDALLQWKQQTYWAMSMVSKAYRNSNSRVSSMGLNTTGLYLLGSDPDIVVLQMNLAAASFRFCTVESSGKFVISSLINGELVQEFSAPEINCQVPLVCGNLGLCLPSSEPDVSMTCSCPQGFHIANPETDNGCSPLDKALSLPASNSCNIGRQYRYLELDIDAYCSALYFAFPQKQGLNLSECQDLCSDSCECSGVFHDNKNSSGSCYLLPNNVSFNYDAEMDTFRFGGYIKTELEYSGESIKPRRRKYKNLVLSLLLLPVLLALAVFGIIWLHKRRKRITNRDTSFSEHELRRPIRFNYEQLAVATDNFTSHIGSGGFGEVYKATLQDGSVVAVKKMKNSSGRGIEEFRAEIAVIGSTHHVNLVRLKGYCCVRPDCQMIVVEYMNRGSLDKVLFGNNGPNLTWPERFGIALGTARGLAYLHDEARTKIIHCDVKPENILLNDKLQVKISDFGMSKFLGTGEEELSRFNTLRGTVGYLAPEWLVSASINDRMDVYSYGMVLLEIVRGKRNWAVQVHCEEINVPESVYFPLLALEMHLVGRYLELVDPRLDLEGGEDVEKLVRVALCCLHKDPRLRPSMDAVVRMLTHLAPLSQPKIESLDYLRLYGRVNEGGHLTERLVYKSLHSREF